MYIAFSLLLPSTECVSVRLRVRSRKVFENGRTRNEYAGALTTGQNLSKRGEPVGSNPTPATNNFCGNAARRQRWR